MKSLLIFSFICMFLFSNLLATTIHVPSQQSTIQAGIDVASNFDTVLVDTGRYSENINFKGKLITVASHFVLNGDTSFISNTIIDGSQSTNPDTGSVVLFISEEDTNSVLTGFTITGGTGTYVNYPQIGSYWSGGGILIYLSGAKIENNIIRNNQVNATMAFSAGIEAAGEVDDIIIIRNNIITQNILNGSTDAGGGGVGLFTKGTIIFDKNKVTKNKANGNSWSGGGGIYIVGDYSWHGSIRLNQNRISHNEADGGSMNDWGGGIYVRNNCPILTNNIISHNKSDWGGGIITYSTYDSWPTGGKLKIVNNTFTRNNAVSGGGISLSGRMVHADVMNSISWNDSVTWEDPEIHLYNYASISVVYSDIEGGYSGEGNIDADPCFYDSLCNLADSSFCLGVGIDSFEISGTCYYAPPFDYDGDPRPMPLGSMPDIGAQESVFISGIYSKSQNDIPNIFSLKQNYPNPFNPSTTIKYTLSKSEKVKIEVFNLLGQKIKTLLNKQMPSGSHEVEFIAKDLPSGVYLYKIEAGDPSTGSPNGQAGQGFQQVKKMILLK